MAVISIPLISKLITFRWLALALSACQPASSTQPVAQVDTPGAPPAEATPTQVESAPPPPANPAPTAKIHLAIGALHLSY